MSLSNQSDSYKEACELFERLYPETVKAVSPTGGLAQALAPTLISPHTLTLPKKILEQAKSVVRGFFELRQNENYVSHVEYQRAGDLPLNKNFSTLMSYDFHLNENKELKLIEINTNASSGLLVDLQYERAKVSNPFGLDFKKDILATFREEYALCGFDRTLKTIAIIDHQPLQQKMYIEFLMYAELFRKAGFEVIIDDEKTFRNSASGLVHESGKTIDLVYNRHTDFYLLTADCAPMREAYRSLKTCFTPNPREYALLADKERLQEITRDGFLEAMGISPDAITSIRSCLLKTFSLHDFTREEAWAQRKKFFFKPARAFGGKAAYKGSSISRGPFEQLWEGDTIAQEFVPAPEIMLPTSDGTPLKYKYDLRFYVYKDKIQLCNARVYQGQTTNATTAGGGLTPIIFE